MPRQFRTQPLPPELRAAEPMVLGERRTPFNSHDWIFEIKVDGYRILSAIAHGKAYLKTRRGADATAWYPEVVRALGTVPGGLHVLDGEVVVMDEIGRTDFDRMHARSRMRGYRPGCDPVAYCIFDALMIGGVDVCRFPIEERKLRLKQLLTPTPSSLLPVSHVDHDGIWLFEQAVMLELEVIVAKRHGSVYQPGAISTDW